MDQRINDLSPLAERIEFPMPTFPDLPLDFTIDEIVTIELTVRYDHYEKERHNVFWEKEGF